MKRQSLQNRRRVALPRYGEYNCVFKYILQVGLGAKCVLPPPITRRTIQLGAAASPDTVCMPYKTLMGSMIEALENGAEVLVMSGGDCRLGYFGQLMEQTLRDMGYSFDYLNLQEYRGSNMLGPLKAIRKTINPHASYTALVKAAMDALKMLSYVDEITELYYRISGPSTDPQGCKKVYQQFLKDMYAAADRAAIEKGHHTALEFLTNVPAAVAHPLRVGVVGEYYTVMDAPSNLFLQQKLADMGVSVERWMNLSSLQLKQYGGKNLGVSIRDLLHYSMGPTSVETLWCARRWAEDGFDGLVHVKSAGCTPEIDTMALLQQLSRDHHIPILYLTYDTQTGDVGLQTRLEAFYDMIAMRKRVD